MQKANSRNIYMTQLILLLLFIGLFSSLYASANNGDGRGETTLYTTYSFEYEGSHFNLYMATSNGKFLYAGIMGDKEMASCTLNNQKFYDAHYNAPKRGKVVCGNFQSHFAKDSLIKPTYKKKPVKLQQTQSFTTQELKIEGKMQNGSYSVLISICGNNEKVNAVINEAFRNICKTTDYAAMIQEAGKVFARFILKRCGDEVSAWELVSNARIRYFDSKIIAIEETPYYYCGGAHGVTEKSYIHFNIHHGGYGVIGVPSSKQLEHELVSLLWDKLQAFVAENKAELLIDKDDFRASDDVVLSYDGLDYIYPPYSVLPYSYGFITLTLSKDEVISLFGEEFARELWHYTHE